GAGDAATRVLLPRSILDGPERKGPRPATPAQGPEDPRREGVQSPRRHDRMSAPRPGAGEPRMAFCQKLQKTLPGLDAAPWPGALGQRIYEHISAEAWRMWEERMKMI